MNTSTLDFKGRSAKRLGVVLLGFAVALAGTLAFSNGQAKASDPFKMEFNHSRLNLGFLFTGGEYKYLPAPATLPGQVSNPNFVPADPASATNPTTVFSETATPLPDYNELNQADFESPAPPPAGTGANALSFKPLGCGTPVTFGLYAALKAPFTFSGGANLIDDPRPSAATFNNKLVVPIANAGDTPAYYRVLAKGAIVPDGETIGGQQGPWPTEDTVWRPISVAALQGAPVSPGLATTLNPSWCPNPANAEVSGTVDSSGNVTIAPEGFDFPVSQLDVSTVVAGTYAPVTLKAEENLSGKFDAATGQLNLSGKMNARVLNGLQYDPLGSYCQVNLKGLSLTTSASEPKSVGFLGAPFSTGSTNVEKLEGPGALTGTWNVTSADVEPIGFSSAAKTEPINCAQSATLGAGNGGIWLSTSAENPPAYPNPKLALTKMTGKKKVKGGKKVKVTVTVRNTGVVSGTARVTLKSSNKKRATVPKSVSVTVPKGATRSRTFTVKTKKRKGKVTISGKLGKKILKLPIRVR